MVLKNAKYSHIQKALCTFEFGNFNFLIFLNEMQSFHSNLETQLEKQFQSLSHDHHYMFVSPSLNFMEPFPRGSNHQTIFYLIEIHSFRFLIDMQTILDEKKIFEIFHSVFFFWVLIKFNTF